MQATYIHGTGADEQARLAALNALTNRRFLEFLRLDEARRVLEVGSGLGILTHAVALQAPAAQVVGVEHAEAQLARAPTGVHNLQFVQGDAHALPFPAATFDVVYCRYVLEHLADPAAALREMRRVLLPGGRVFLQENDISINRCDPPAPRFDAVWGQFAALQQLLGGHPFIGRELHRHLRDAGFDAIELSVDPEVHWASSPGFDAWVVNLIGNVQGAASELLARESLGVTTADIDGAIAELEAFRAVPEASVWFYWNRATARR